VERWFKVFWRSVSVGACSLFVSALLGLLAWPVQAKGPAPAGIESIALVELPKQGRETYALILAGGPFPYEKDGSVFGNRERILPAQKRGYYREYTVKTPYSRDRGARRIVCGGSQPSQPEACYYTSDHYASFKRIAP
jgi:ribonuclease T1